jgi:hypothetical protein
MSGDAIFPPWLIIVRRDSEMLYQHLRQAFESDPQVTVIKDRRRAERRARAAAVPEDRRTSDRRTLPTVRDERIWESLRFRLIHQDEKMTVYQAATGPAARARLTATLNTGGEQQTRTRDSAGGRRSVGSTRPARSRRKRT